MKFLFRSLTLVIAGLLIFSFGFNKEIHEPPVTESELDMHIVETRDTLAVLERHIAEMELSYLDSLLAVEKKNLLTLEASLDSAGIAEIFAAHQTCEEITYWVGMTLETLSGSSE